MKDDSELPGLIKACDSIVDFVDEINIMANGKEVKMIEEYCNHSKINYSYKAWGKDFAEMRNFNFSQASKEADYIWWMDSDDVLIGGENLHWIAEQGLRQGHDTIFLPYWYSCRFKGSPDVANFEAIDLFQMRERLLKPSKHNWVGRLHETPVPITGSRDKYTAFNPEKNDPHFITVMHLSTDKDTTSHMQRNEEILELQLADEKAKGEADPRTLLYLIKIYAEDNESTKEKLERAIKYGEEYLVKSGWDEAIAECHEYMGICYGRLGDNKKAIDSYHKAMVVWPHNPMPYIRLASAYYNAKDYRQAKHWLSVAVNIDLDKRFTSGMLNVKGIKATASELAMRLSLEVDQNIDLAVKYANDLLTMAPNEQNEGLVNELENRQAANVAIRSLIKYVTYLKEAGSMNEAVKVIENLPDYFTTLPVASKLREEILPPRKWGRNEICYYASFGGPSIGRWDESSLEKGLGGSETAVIRLAQEWVKLGWRVVVYGDPVTVGERDGINWRPWYEFNWKDNFNIFIQWRSWSLCEKIKCRKFLLDLHDTFSPIDFTESQIRHIDKILVKSLYQRNLAPKISDDKFAVISNGIDL